MSYEGLKINRLRFNNEFWKQLKVYEQNNHKSEEEIIEIRNLKLQSIIHHSYSTVPYYKELFDKIKISPNDIKTLEDLQILPITEKKDVQHNPQKFLSTAIPRSQVKVQSTSGSTGTSLQVYTTQKSINEQWAVWWRYRRALGIKFNEWCAYFASRPIVPKNQKKPPFWRVNYPGKQVHFSAFHGNTENYYYYYKRLKASNIRWIHGYPSQITPFASFLLNNNLESTLPIEFVTTGGENLYDYQRKIIKKAFGISPYSHYGLTEAVANISEDINHSLKVDEDFAAVEFLKNSDDSHRIIGTSLTNYAMPLLRFDTADIAYLKDEANDYKKIRSIDFIDGRDGEFILLPDGTKIGTLSALFTETSSFSEAQLIQRPNYDLLIKVVKNNNDYAQDELLVRKLLEHRVGKEIDISFEYVESIPRSSSGKLRYVISEINNGNHDNL